ncbi:unnamed protein product [Clonostachys rosea]|uniref:Heterokaryon incompatibility domain-containing protein n=1 Tax=Bionectria ochroleuca TaxID=29856 RepID=A0ABY6U4I6_BIOOC|nr:unnamed protein product [Clonostachys rosea]
MSPSKSIVDNLPLRSHAKRYIALSHCWGGSSINHQTTRANIEQRRQGFRLHELPKTFQDAVQVTRNLGIDYLWIDSLCIIQGPDGDWESESRRMEQVFTSAYCTIAATSASDSTTGFLGNEANDEGLFIRAPSGNQLYASSNIAAFDDDTSKALLNKRAWVLQERLLSPRTIHFTRSLVYGECGEGVCAGNGITLKSASGSQNYFAVDPNFPGRLENSGINATWGFLKSLIEDYSQRGISVPTDRAVAISGLMSRIEAVLPSTIHHGVIKRFLHRTLLWKRSCHSRRIEYPSSLVPSWSWMSYKGAVNFVEDKFSDLEVIRSLNFDSRILRATVWELVDADVRLQDINGNASHQQLVDSHGLKKGWISFDEEGEPSRLQYVVVIARHRRLEVDDCRYYVLFVKLGEATGTYERIGMGKINEDCLLKETRDGQVF